MAEEPPSSIAALTAPYFTIMSIMSLWVAPRDEALRPSVTMNITVPSALCPIAVR